ncbi:monovalent cation/H(+) antiporter subunit G [Paenibacillus puerhi]|uniref:monovalent cation/H(+) antiporter subunit G n=1 Tax=Paenibacillus puerhi TaxID=2692622 RepID=UPI00135C5983|nr:monovalent cation/H(+) antiporter subunit G [Paenibacillus puerhi]
MNRELLALSGEIIIGIVIAAGAIVSALSAWGLIRLPDVYTRSHAAAKSATLGVLLVLAGAFVYLLLYLNHVSVKVLLGIVFVFLTSPVAGHLTGRAAHRSGVPLWKRSVMDDLGQEGKQEGTSGDYK